MLYLPSLEKYTDVTNLDYSIFTEFKPAKRPRGNHGGKYKAPFLDCVCAFDIETTGIKEIEQAVMYIWQFQIDDRITVFGRTWEDFLTFLNKTKEVLQDKHLLIYVHNLSYEFSFLKGIYPFAVEEVFAVQRRKVLKCTMMENFEFRCSYLQSNLNLKEFTRKFNVKHMKLTDYDYQIPRYWFTSLTVEEMKYCQNDVLGLVEAIRAEMKRDGDTVYTIPLTSTGYVRRDVKKCLKGKLHHQFMSEMFPDVDLYFALREAFRGGDTHGNRFYCDTILEDVHSADRSSSYPDVLCNCDFPMTPFVKLLTVPTVEDVDRMIFERGRCVLMRVYFRNVTLKDRQWGLPYFSKDKTRRQQSGTIYFNGRILSSQGFEATITDVDYRIIRNEYNFTMEIIDIWKCRYKPLPEPLKAVIIDYYKRKTELKGVTGEDAIFYDKAKNSLNSVYGMMATDPMRIPIEYHLEDGDFHYSTDVDLEEILNKAQKKAFIAYQWGVWCTALARYRLHEGVALAHSEHSDFVYADTDSVKYTGVISWEAYNEARKADSIKNGAFATDRKGITHYMGVFEQEADYQQFKTLGAKKYAYIQHGKLGVTISGVNKKLGAKELSKKGGLESLKEGFIFTEAGGTEAVYNDKPDIREYVIDGKTVFITSNVYLSESTYTVGLTQQFKDILTMCKIDVDFLDWLVYNENALKGKYKIYKETKTNENHQDKCSRP